MRTDIKKKNANIYEVAKKLGLNKKEINSILTGIGSGNEHLSSEAGPDPYWGAMYGIISIKDIQYCINLKDKTNILEDKI